MPQTSISNMPPLAAGSPLDQPAVTKGYVTGQAISSSEWGVGLVFMQSDPNKVRLPIANIVELTFSADFVASNTIDMNVVSRYFDLSSTTTEAMAQVTFAVSQANTMDLIADALTALDAVESVEVGGPNGRTLTIYAVDDTEISISGVVIAGGVSQPTVTSNLQISEDVFAGVLPRLTGTDPISYTDIGTEFPADTGVSLITKGSIAVPSSAVTAAQIASATTVYLRYLANGAQEKGYFAPTTDTSRCMALPSSVRWISRGLPAVSGIQAIEVNLP